LFSTPNPNDSKNSRDEGTSSSTRKLSDPWFLDTDNGIEGKGDDSDANSSSSNKNNNNNNNMADDADEYCQIIDDFGCQAFESVLLPPTEQTAESGSIRWLRLENGIDPTLEDRFIDQQSVFDMIDSVKQIQGKYGPCNLYERQWEPTSFETTLLDATLQTSLSTTYNGEKINGDTKIQKQSTFTVMQFNTLAEGLSSAPDAKKPFPADSDELAEKESTKFGFGGFAQTPFKETVLDFALRRWRLLEVMLTTYHSKSRFDILAMEEVDRHWGFFQPLLQLFGYESFFAPKKQSPGLRLGWYSDGCALFWKKDIFQLVSASRHEYKVGSQVYILAVLRHCATHRAMVVAVTHLKAQASAVNERVRCKQVEELVSEIAKCVAKVSNDESILSRSIPVILAGDLNADAQCEFEESCITQGVLHYPITQGNGSHDKLKSTYCIQPPPTSFYTTWKFRENKETRRIIDYIFYAGGLQCTSTLQVPNEEDLEATRLPGLRYPSDHMMIAAEFTLDCE
jgi:mRNA deadenylase 3'-5' endonuclease subunit Ccr4